MRKKLVLVLVILIISLLNIQPVMASTPPNDGIDLCTDEIIYRYRVNNGIYQYRRWNETQKCWVDPYWIDV